MFFFLPECKQVASCFYSELDVQTLMLCCVASNLGSSAIEIQPDLSSLFQYIVYHHGGYSCTHILSVVN